MQLEKVYTKNNIPIEQEVRYIVIKIKVLWIYIMVWLVVAVCIFATVTSLIAYFIVGLP